jgi:hypothetical protein
VIRRHPVTGSRCCPWIRTLELREAAMAPDALEQRNPAGEHFEAGKSKEALWQP